MVVVFVVLLLRLLDEFSAGGAPPWDEEDFSHLLRVFSIDSVHTEQVHITIETTR